jgi:hypothetical protein
MRLRTTLLASTLAALALFTGCAAQSAWTHDRTGRPIQTWERLGPTTHVRHQPPRVTDDGRGTRDQAKLLAREEMRRRRMRQ